jgi:type VI protein secretion system component VasF
MGLFSNRRDDLGKQLSAARPRPSSELVEGIAARVSARPMPRRYSRVAFGLALATFMAGLFATFGGVGYAASGVTDTVHAVKSAVHVTAKPARSTLSSAKAQYGHSQVAAAIAKVQRPTKHVAAPVAVHQAVKSSQLPFTGLSLLPTALIAFFLIGVGVLLRRRENEAN